MIPQATVAIHPRTTAAITATRPATPSLAHQEAYCLHAGHKDCPVYWQPWKEAFPSSLQAAEAARPRRSAALTTALAFVVCLAALGFLASQLLPTIFAVRPLIPVTGGSLPPATIAPSMTALQSPASASAVPTSTLIATSTALPQTHTLEIPFDVDGHKLVMHRVGAGDIFDILDAKYETTPEVLRALNHSLTGSLLANTVIVIAPGLQTVDPALPSFRVREVTGAATTIDDLAQQYHVERTVLRHYNGCTDACSLEAGNWILVPVMPNPAAGNWISVPVMPNPAAAPEQPNPLG